MKSSGLWWIFLTIGFYQASDIMLRVLTLDIHFISGCILQALPVMLFSTVLLVRENGLRQLRAGHTVLLLILAFGVVQVLLGNLSYLAAIHFGGLSVASPAIQSQAIWAILLGALFLHEKISNQAKLGILCFAVGIVLITWYKSKGIATRQGLMLGTIFGISAGLCWAISSLVQKKLFARNITQNAILSAGMLFGMLLLAVFGLCTQPAGFIASFSNASTWKILLPGTCSSIACWCCAKALRQTPMSAAIPLLSVSIIFNTILGWFFWKEYVSPGTIVGLIFAFSGILLSQNLIQRKKALYEK